MLGFIGAFYVILAVVLILYEQAFRAGYDALQKVLRLLLYWLAPLYCGLKAFNMYLGHCAEACAIFLYFILPFVLIIFVITEYFIVKRFMKRVYGNKNVEETQKKTADRCFFYVMLVIFVLSVLFLIM